MKSLLLVPLLLTSMAAAQPRKFRCSLESHSARGSSSDLGPILVVDEEAIQKEIEDRALSHPQEKNLKKLHLISDFPLAIVSFEALIGPACSVDLMPGCTGYNSGGPSHSYKISIMEKKSKFQASLSEFKYTSTLENSYSQLSLRPPKPIPDGEGTKVVSFSVECFWAAN